jgi:hypothetical protein
MTKCYINSILIINDGKGDDNLVLAKEVDALVFLH